MSGVPSNVSAFLITQAILLPILAGSIVLLVWNARRGRRIRAEAEARGETIPSRNGRRIVYVVLGVVCIVIGFTILRH